MLYWISLPYATFGVVARVDVVVEAPPIAKRCLGRDIVTVLNYYRRKGATIKAL